MLILVLPSPTSLCQAIGRDSRTYCRPPDINGKFDKFLENTRFLIYDLVYLIIVSEILFVYDLVYLRFPPKLNSFMTCFT